MNASVLNEHSCEFSTATYSPSANVFLRKYRSGRGDREEGRAERVENMISVLPISSVGLYIYLAFSIISLLLMYSSGYPTIFPFFKKLADIRGVSPGFVSSEVYKQGLFGPILSVS